MIQWKRQVPHIVAYIVQDVVGNEARLFLGLLNPRDLSVEDLLSGSINQETLLLLLRQS